MEDWAGQRRANKDARADAGSLQEGVVAEQQVFMRTKKSSLEKAATGDGASTFTWLCHTTYGHMH